MPTNMFTMNSLQFGSALEMVLLAFALADRFNVIRREKARAQQDALEAQHRLVETLPVIRKGAGSARGRTYCRAAYRRDSV